MGQNWLVILAYILLRVAGRIAGARLGGALARAERPVRNWMGVALMPQAGVALGMALIATQHFPELNSIITIIVTATVVFEIIGPICTRWALQKMEASETDTPTAHR